MGSKKTILNQKQIIWVQEENFAFVNYAFRKTLVKMVKRKSKKKSSTQRRRTRNDPKNRDFKCGCGKSYLSYPALYTHLKDKHEAKKPPGTKIPETSGKGKRGRPPTV